MTAAELLSDELTLSPARTARMVRMTVLVAIVVVLSMALRVPDVAVSAYMIFFLAQRDVATTMRTAIGGVIGVTVAIACCFVNFSLTLGEPALRLPLMVVLAFGGCYLMRATPAGPLGFIIGFVTFYTLTIADQVPSPEALVRALLWLWVVIAYPAALLVVADLAFASRPDEVYRTGVVTRLAAAADFLALPPEDVEARARVERFARTGPTDLVPYVERGGPPATASTRAALLHQVDLLGFLLRGLSDDLRRDAVAQPVLTRTSAACRDARDTLEGGAGGTRGHLARLAAARRDLDAASPPVRAAIVPVVNCVQTIVVSVDELSAPIAERGRAAHARKPAAPADTTEAVRFAFKVTLAGMSAYLLYSGLEWYSIHTATITCFFVAKDSVGATIHKLTLRLLGAIIGATIGMLAILYVLPALETIGGLVVLVAMVTLFAAWIGTGSERIQYAGWQIALAFYLTVLQGFSRTSKLYVGRDRVIGILIGNILISVVFTSLWPVRAAPAYRRALSRALEALAAMLRTLPGDRDALDRAEADFHAHLTTARQYESPLRFERARGVGLVTTVQGLFVPIHAIMRSWLPATTSPAVGEALSRATVGVSDWLRQLAPSIESHAPSPQPPDVNAALTALAASAQDEHQPTPTRARLLDQSAWLELLRGQCQVVAERAAP